MSKYRPIYAEKVKILTTKPMLQRFPIILAIVYYIMHLKTYYMKSDKSYILYTEQSKLLKKVYNNIMNSITL